MGGTPRARLITDAALPLCGDAEKIHAVFSLCNILKKLKIVGKNIYFFIQTQELLNTVYLKHIRILHFILFYLTCTLQVIKNYLTEGFQQPVVRYVGENYL